MEYDCLGDLLLDARIDMEESGDEDMKLRYESIKNRYDMITKGGNNEQINYEKECKRTSK